LGIAMWGSLILAGCSSAPSGTDRAAAASQSMLQFRDNIKLGQDQLEKCIASMNGLNTAKTDLKGAYDRYCAELEQTESVARTIKADADEMRTKGRTFFKKWEEELEKIQNEDLRAKAKSRADERSKEYATIEMQMGTAKGKWDVLSVEFKDVKQYLSNDLTASGVSSLSKTFTQANLDSGDLKRAMGAVASSLDKFRADFEAAAAQKKSSN
jgi:chromosome segregation ATPase